MKNYFRLTYIILPLIILCCSSCSGVFDLSDEKECAECYEITGRLVDQFNNPIAGYYVYADITKVSFINRIGRAITDANGIYRLEIDKSTFESEDLDPENEIRIGFGRCEGSFGCDSEINNAYREREVFTINQNVFTNEIIFEMEEIVKNHTTPVAFKISTPMLSR